MNFNYTLLSGCMVNCISGLYTFELVNGSCIVILLEDTQQNLVRHLLRTVCTDIMNLVLNAVATDNMMSVNDEIKFSKGFF